MAKKALIVDDSRSMRLLVSLVLRKCGFEILESENGQEALNKLKAGQTVDLIITDINMPVMDGMTLIRQARQVQQAQKTPILVLTTESGEEMKAAAKAAGASGWIVKPFQPEMLEYVVSKVVAA